MPVLVPPSTQPIPNGYDRPPNTTASFHLNQGDVVTWGLQSAQRPAGNNQTDFHADLWNAARTQLLVANGWSWETGAAQRQYAATAPIDCILQLYQGGNSNGLPDGQAFGYHAETTPALVVYCANGTQLSAGGNATYYITPAFVAAICAEAGVPGLIPWLTGLYGGLFDAGRMCDQLPPPLPAIDLASLDASYDTKMQIFQAVAWLSLCECVPGTPTPVEPPPPTVVIPPGAPVSPTFNCDNVDPCAALVAIQQQLAALQTLLSSDYQLNTVVQRYGQPFAYVRGAQHSNLSGAGTIPVSRLVGMQAVIVDRPGGLQEFSGAPAYITDLGWMSLLTGDGLIDEVRLTRDVQTWTPRLFGLATQFGYSLREGVVANFVELEAEV